MTPWFNPKRNQMSFAPTHLATMGLAAFITASSFVLAASSRDEATVASIESNTGGEPIMAIISLSSQRIAVYDSHGLILRAPVSSGQRGRETPAGIFSVIEKEAEHYSNLYDDAYMPNMMRLTWSGIALHGGRLPGHPASHGCIRLPYDFAERLFDATKVGMRVIVAPTDVAPVPIMHPLLFPSKTDKAVIAAARAAEADSAARKADEARLAAAAASREVARTTASVRAARNLKLSAEAQLATAQLAVAYVASAEAKEQAEDAKAKAAARFAELEARLSGAESELQAKLSKVALAREAAVAAEAARAAAAEEARKTALDLEPVSIFISRKAQRLYVRRTFRPVLEIPVTIRDLDVPVGTHVFTALERTAGYGDVKWSVVSLVGGHPEGRTAGVLRPEQRLRDGHAEQVLTDPPNAKAALDRLVIPQDTFDQIAAMVSPRSSLIISDEALSPETGRGTEFVVLMSDEPQGGVNFRRHQPRNGDRYDFPGDRLFYRRAPFVGRDW